MTAVMTAIHAVEMTSAAMAEPAPALVAPLDLDQRHDREDHAEDGAAEDADDERGDGPAVGAARPALDRAATKSRQQP